MNPLAALSIDRTALMGENLRPHGAVFYPTLHSLSAEKPQEPAPSLPLGYELLYKPDISLLDGQKAANGYVGLYKNAPAGLQKPLLFPAAGAESLGLDHRVLHGDKPADLGLNGAGGFLRLPWIGSYADASMYPFLDMAYKASFLSQPPHFLHQQLAYQSLVAAGSSGGSAPSEDRLFYLPAYAQAHISSQLGAPIRMSTVAPAAVISPLPHSQDKTLHGLSPKVHQEPSAFSTSPQIHQDAMTQVGHHPERQHGSSGSKSLQTTSTKTSLNRGSGGGTAGAAVLDSPPATRPPCSVPSIQPLITSTADLQTSLYKSTAPSSLSVPHASLYVSSGRCSPKHCGSTKTKDAKYDRSHAEKSTSPGKTLLDRAVPHKTAKTPGEKPLDLSAKELEAFPNGFPAKLEALAKLGYLPPSRYGLYASQDQHLKEGLPPPTSISEKTLEYPELMGTASSTWLVPNSSSQSLKSKNVDHNPHRPQPPVTPGAPTVESMSSATSSGRPSVVAPSPKSKVVWPRVSTADSEKVVTPAKSDPQEVQAYLHQQTRTDSRSSSSQIYGDSYLPPGLGYTNRYIPYSVAENMSLQRLPMQAKGPPMYPHPILLGGSSFYTTHMAPKHNLPYGIPTYQGPQEMVPTLIPTYNKDELENRTKNQEKLFSSYRNKERTEAESSQESATGRDRSSHQTAKASGKSHTYVRDDIVCIDLVHDETDEVPPTKSESTKHPSDTRRHAQDKESRPLKVLNLDQGPHGSSSPLPEVEPLGQFSDLPEELTMRCARTSPHQFTRKSKGVARDLVSDVSSVGGSGSKPEAAKPHETRVEEGPSLVPAGKDGLSSDCDAGGNQTSPTVCSLKRPNPADFDVQVPEAKRFNPGTLPGLNRDPSSQTSISRSSAESRCSSLTSTGSTCEPTHSLRGNGQERIHCLGQGGRILCTGQSPCGMMAPTSGSSFPEGPACQHLPPTNRGEQAPESPAPGDETRDPGVQDGLDSHEDEDEDAACGHGRRSSLTKRIANSSGYVGDRIKCVTTELNADSSQLGREQRALQRAMLRFSELELKEREGGGGGGEDEEEEGEELAGGQRGEGGRRAEEGGGGEEGGWEHSRGGGGGGGGGGEGGGRTPTAAAAAAEAPSGFLPVSAPGCILVFKEKNDDSTQEKDQEEEKEVPEEQQQQRFLPVPSGLLQAPSLGLAGSSPAAAAAAAAAAALTRRRIFSLEPFHQSSIVSGRLKRGREEEKEEEEGHTANANRKLAHDSALDEVKKLKVCIELNGLRLNKPRLPGELSQWFPSDRRHREDLSPVAVRSEVNGGLSDAAFLRTDGGLRVFHVAPPTSNLPRQQFGFTPRLPLPPPASPASPRLQDKHQRLRESRRVSAFLPLLPPPLPSSYSSSATFPLRCHDDDPDKPKGKRPCKLKHTAGGEGAGAEGAEVEGGGGGAKDQEEEPSEKVSLPHSPEGRPPSPRSPSPRPAPPEVRRLIVNKNAGETLLQRAARLGYEEVVLYCLERRICDVNHRDNAGYCALHEACARGWLGIVRHLVEHGADVNCSAVDGTRPLHDAVGNDHLEVVRLLLACGADPTLTSYSGRGPINMTHSAAMETFLDEYLSDLQGRSEGDPGIYWEFYGSSVCEPSSERGVYNVLADPPGPEEEEDEEEDQDVEQRARREVFEFELSDRPLLPCYNIQMSLSQGRRNWLLLADVLARLRMTSRSFRRLFPQLNVQSLPEDEFYRQASLSQLLTGPDRSELASFRPDARDPLELVEATPELAGMLGSSLECVDTRHEAQEPPPPPPSPTSPPPPPQQVPLSGRETDAAAAAGEKATTRYELTVAAETETKMNASAWEPQRPESHAAVVMNATVWELQRPRDKNPRTTESASVDSTTLPPVQPEEATAVKTCEPQRLRSRSTGPSGSASITDEPPSKVPADAAAAPSNVAADPHVWKNMADKTVGVPESTSGDGVESEPHRLSSKNADLSPGPARVDAPACPGLKRASGGDAATPKTDAATCETHGSKSLKLDAAWQRNLGNVRVHIRDLGIRVGAIQRAVKAEAGKVVVKSGRVKMRS